MYAPVIIFPLPGAVTVYGDNFGIFLTLLHNQEAKLRPRRLQPFISVLITPCLYSALRTVFTPNIRPHTVL